MNTQTTFSVRIDSQIKKEAQELAQKLGISLSGVINLQLRNFLKQRTIIVSDNEEIINMSFDFDKEGINQSEFMSYLNKSISND